METYAVYYIWILCTVCGRCLAACGCNGTNQLYVLYKPPVSGWYELDSKGQSMHRYVNINTEQVQYIFQYMYTLGKWYLFERSHRKPGTTTVTSFKEKKAVIICPSNECECSTAFVDGEGPLGGEYYRSDVWKEKVNHVYRGLLPRDYVVNLTETPAENFSLNTMTFANLSNCIQKNNMTEGRANYTLETKNVTYIREDKQYYITRAPNGDLWWIYWQDYVYAISNHGAPCLHQLPKETQWFTVTEDGGLEINENMSVTC